MKPNRAYWTEKLKVAHKAWARLRPDDKIRDKSASGRQFSFFAYRPVDHSAKYRMLVTGDDISSGWTLNVRLGFADLTPAALEAAVTDLDRSEFALFDVVVRLAADALVSRSVAWSLDVLPFDVSDEELALRLATYSQKIDRLCETFGGYDIEAFQSLAKWCLRHRAIIGYQTIGGMGPVCAALEYGDRPLAIELLREVEKGWEENLEREPDRPLVRELYARWRGHCARARRLMDLPVPD